jgi:hypothetical protein
MVGGEKKEGKKEEEQGYVAGMRGKVAGIILEWKEE